MNLSQAGGSSQAPGFDAGVLNHALLQREHIAEQMHKMAEHINGLQSEYARLSAMQVHVARELHHCNQEQAELAGRHVMLQNYLERQQLAQQRAAQDVFPVHPGRATPMHLEGHAGGWGLPRIGSPLLESMQGGAGAHTTHSAVVLAEMQGGLTELKNLVSSMSLMSGDAVARRGLEFENHVHYLMVKSSFLAGTKCMQYANVLGVTHNVFLCNLLRKAVFCDVFAKTPSGQFSGDKPEHNTWNRTRLRAPALLVGLQKKASDILANFSSSLLTINVSEATSPVTFAGVRSAIICAVGVVHKSQYDYPYEDDEWQDEKQDSDDEVQYCARILPEITRSDVDSVPLLSFQVPRNNGFSLYMFNLSDADLCLFKNTVIDTEFGSARITEDSLVSHTVSRMRNEPDNNVPADGFSLVVDMPEPQPSTTMDYTLKDANNKVFLRVETSLATRRRGET